MAVFDDEVDDVTLLAVAWWQLADTWLSTSIDVSTSNALLSDSVD